MYNDDQEIETLPPSRSWQLDKRIPVSLLFAILIQSLCVVVWAMKVDNRVVILEQTSVNSEKFAHLDERMTSIKDEIGSMKTEMIGIHGELHDLAGKHK
jgi:hypothetical protein